MGGEPLITRITPFAQPYRDSYMQNSVRHNLSSGRAFKKMERSTGEHGKGFFWSVDPQFEHTFEEQEAKVLAHAQSLAQEQTQPRDSSHGQGLGSSGGKDGKRKKGVPADPPLKRSVKNGNGPLPPPLTSTPLPLLSRPVLVSLSSAPIPSTTAVNGTSSRQESGDGQIKTESATSEDIELSVRASTQTPKSLDIVAGSSSTTPTATLSSTSNLSPLSSIPGSVRLPIMVGHVPSSDPSVSGPTENPPPIVLHNNSLVLSPLIFSSLTPEQLKALEEMGAQRALEVLQAHIVRYLKERMGRRKKRKAGGEKRKEDAKAEGAERQCPFTTVPLPRRGGASASRTQPSTCQSQVTGGGSVALVREASSRSVSLAAQLDFPMAENENPTFHRAEKESVPVSVDCKPPVPIPITSTNTAMDEDAESPASPTIAIDENQERVTKRRRMDVFSASLPAAKVADISFHGGSIVEVVQPGDEDIEIEIC